MAHNLIEDEDEVLEQFNAQEGDDDVSLNLTDDEHLERLLTRKVGAENIVKDSDGKIMKWLDPDSGKFFFNKDYKETDGEVLGIKLLKPKIEEDGEEEEEEDGEDDKSKSTIASDFEGLMSSLEIDSVEIGEVNKNVSDLTPVEKEAVLLHLVNNLAKNQVNVAAPVTEKLSEDEKIIRDFFKSGKTLKDIKELVGTISTPANLDNLDDKEIVRLSFKEQYPKKSDAQIQKLIDSHDDEELQKEVADYKELKAKEVKTPEELIKEQVAAAKAAEIADDEAQISQIISFSKGVKEIDGIPVDRDIINVVLEYILPEKAGEIPALIKETSTPQGLMRVGFYAALGKQLIEDAVEQGEQNILGNMPDAGEIKKFNKDKKAPIKPKIGIDNLPDAVKAKVKEGSAIVV